MRKGSASSAEIGSGKPCFTANDLSPVGNVVAAGMHLSTRILICHDTTHVALNFRRETAAALQGCLPVTCAQHCSCTHAGLTAQDILPRWDILTRVDIPRHAVCLPCAASLSLLLGDRRTIVFEKHFWLCFEVIYRLAGAHKRSQATGVTFVRLPRSDTHTSAFCIPPPCIHSTGVSCSKS